MADDGIVYYKGEPYPQGTHFERGIPYISVDEIMKSSAVKAQINELYQGLVLSKQQFEQLVIPVIRNFVMHVHYLPASETHHHRGPTGLLRHSLEVSDFALKIARARMFDTGNTPRARRDNEERWQLAALLGGLMHDIGKPYADYTVVDDKNNQWDFIDPLTTWLEKNKSQRYFLNWKRNRHKEHESTGVSPSVKILTNDIEAYLMKHGPEIYQELMRFSANYNSKSMLAEVIRKADHASCRKDQDNPASGMSEGSGVPTVRHVLDAIKSLLSENKWKVNDGAGRVWVLTDHGVFIDLERGANELAAQIRSLGYPGVPQKINAILQVLSDGGHIQPYADSDGNESLYWEFEVTPPNYSTHKIQLVKITAPSYIFDDMPPSTLPAKLIEAATSKDKGLEVDARAEEKQSKTTNATRAKPKTQAPVPDSSADKPRDFNQMMGELRAIEGEHQPGFNESTEPSEGEQPEEDQNLYDPTLEISKKLSEKLQADQGQQPAEETSNQNSTPTQPPEASAPSKAAGEQINCSADNEVTQSGNPQTSPSDTGGNEKPTEVFSLALPAQHAADADATTQGPQNKPSNAPAKKSRRKRKLSPIQEIEKQAAEINRERARDEMLSSPNSLSIEAIRHTMGEQISENIQPTVALGALVMPTRIKVPTEPPKNAKRPPRNPLGPKTHVDSPLSKHIKEAPAVAKLKPETSNRPAVNKINEKLAKPAVDLQMFRQLPLEDQFQQLLGKVTPDTTKTLADEVIRVVSRELPLGISITMLEDSIRIEPGTFKKALEADLCTSQMCDMGSDGSIHITNEMFRCIKYAIESAQQEASESIGIEGVGEPMTANVTLRDHEDKSIEPQYTKPTPEAVVELLIEQLRIGYGELIESGYQVERGGAYVDSKKTLELIRNKWPHLTVNKLRVALIRAKTPITGGQIKLNIGNN